MKNIYTNPKDQPVAPNNKVNYRRNNLSAIRLPIFFVLVSLLVNLQVLATNYYSYGNLPPNDLNNWWSNTNGTGTHPANFTNGDVFIIQNGNSMTSNASWTISGTGAEIKVEGGGSLTADNTINTPKLTINASGDVIVNNGKTLKINNGTSSPDLLVQGTLSNEGTITLSSGVTSTFDNGGTYQHTRDGGVIPAAVWNRNSTCDITGITTTTPLGLTQTFGNLIWNCPQTGNIQLGGTLNSMTGNLTVISTGSSQLRLTNTSNLTLNIGGDLNISGGSLNFASGAATTKILNLGGNYNQTGGTFTNSNSIPLNFNFMGTGKTFAYSGIFTNTYINYSVNSGASLTLQNNLPVAASRSCTINGTLNCGLLAVTGSGTFSLSDGGTLQIGSSQGISGSLASGNILVTGSRSFSSKANYTYTAGSGSPVTGDGLPLTIENFTVSNSSFNPLTLTNNALTVSVNLIISSGAKLELGADKQLTVNGSTTLNGSNCLVLKSNAGGTASFVNAGAILGAGTAKVERHIVNNWDWHFLSSPVTAQPVWNTTTKNFVPVPGSGNTWAPGTWNWDFYRWAPQGDPNGYTPYPWVNLRGATGVYNSNPLTTAPYGFGSAIPVFHPGTGYLVAYAPDYGLTTPFFSGTLNTGTISIPLVVYTGTNGNSQLYTNNLNLAGNPYPSSLDFDALVSANPGVLSSSSYWIMLGNGTYASYTAGSGGTAGASRYIAPMQGFILTAASNTSLSVSNAMRVHNSQAWLKNGEIFTNRLSMRVSNNANDLSDEIIVHFDPSFGPDGGAIKVNSLAKDAPNLYTWKEAGNFTINQLTSISGTSEIPLCLVPGIDAQYTFVASGLEGFDSNVPILLLDLLNGSMTDLRKNATYTFTSNTGDNPNRFVLRFGQVNTHTEVFENSELFKIFTNDGTFSIENNSGEKNFLVSVYDMHGSLQQQQTAEGRFTKLSMPVAAGMYIVKILSDKGTVSRKIIVR